MLSDMDQLAETLLQLDMTADASALRKKAKAIRRRKEKHQQSKVLTSKDRVKMGLALH